MLDRQKKVYIAGHRGLVGSAIQRRLEREGFTNIVTRTFDEMDLTQEPKVYQFFEEEKPAYVFLAAAKVGGIHANNTYPADFIFQNLKIETNVLDAAYHNGVEKLLFLGSSCIYPKMCPQPIKEDYLLSGPLEPTNDAYALAKIAGIKLCQAYNHQYGTKFISVMPTNLYGINDNFNLKNGHVLPALFRKFYEARQNKEKEVVMWGTGTPRREFLFVDDLADACLFLMDNYEDSDIVNIGTGKDISIRELADLIKEIVGYEGEIIQDTSKPDGTPRKLLDVSKLHAMGWEHKTSLREGIQITLDWYNKTLKENAYIRL